MLDDFPRNSLALNYHYNSNKIGSLGQFEFLPSYKTYPTSRMIEIKRTSQKGESEFIKTLTSRCSHRDFSKQGISLNELGQLLSYSVGLNGKSDNGILLRNYPSAGARYPIEVYPIILDSSDIPLGIYHYNVLNNSLEMIREGKFGEEINSFYSNQIYIKEAPCYILFTMVFERSMCKYGEKGYRFILLDAGHMSQNLYLVSEYLGLGVVELGGGETCDTTMDSLLQINSKEESFFLGFAVGKPHKE